MNDDYLKRLIETQAERTHKKLEAIAEALATLDEELQGEIERVEEKVDRGFGETQAMIKFSHAELDRRVRVLEKLLSDLEARIERLEATVH
jgi:DNA anti-recombination protein RmuC